MGCLLGVMQACGTTEHGGSADPAEPAEFSSGVPADKTLESLSANEVEALCHDAQAFADQAGAKDAGCRFVGVLTAAFTAEFAADTSDAELRTLCSDTY